MTRIEAEHKPIKKSSPAAGAFDEKPVHGRRQPCHLDDIAQLRRTLGRCAIQMHHTFFAVRGRRHQTGTDLVSFSVALHGCGNGPKCRGGDSKGGFANVVGVSRPSQSPARGEQRNRIEHIGFSRAIGTRQNDGPTGEGDFCRGVRAKIRQRKAGDGKP